MDNNFNKITYLNERIKGSYNGDLSKINNANSTSLSPVWNIQSDTRPRFESISPYKEETIYQTFDDGSKVAMFDNFVPGTDNEQRLAEQQSTSEKWANGASKFLLKTATGVLGGTVGTVDALITGVKEGSISAAYNSDVNKWLDDLNKKLDYKLPNYYTQQEKEAGFGESLGSANFWANDFLGGLSFTAGAIVSEGIWAAATGGVSLLAEGASLSRLGTRALTRAELRTAGMAGRTEATAVIRDAVNAPITLQSAVQASRQVNAVKALNALRFTVTSAGYESSMEARQYIKNTEDEWLRRFESENGRTPDSNEYLNFKTNLTSSANAVFAANMVLVGASNMATFGKLALGKSITPSLPNSWFSRNLFGVGFREGAERGTLEAIEASARQKAFGRLYGIAKLGIIEGAFEEGGQRVASETGKAYMLNGYDKNGLRNSYGMQEALYEGLSNTYGTKEGWKEVGLGMLIGVFGGGISGALSGQGLFNETAIDRRNVENAVNYYNEFHVANLIDAQKANSRIYQAIEKSEEANKRGDVVGQIQADREAMIATLERQSNLGGIEFSVSQYQTAMNATPVNELAQELGVTEEEAEQWKSQRIEEYKELASDYDAYNSFTNSLLGDVRIAGMSTQDRNTLGKAITFNMVMGKYALQDSQNITDTLKRFVATGLTTSDGIADAIDTDFALEKAGEESTQNYRKLTRRSRYLRDKQNKLIKRTTELQQYSNREDSVAKTEALNKNTQQLLEVQEQIAETEAQKQILADTVNLQNLSGKQITVQMLDNQSENVLKLGESIASLRNVDPQKHAVVAKLIQEQTRAIRNAKGYEATTKQIQDPKTRYTLLNGWLSSMLKARNNKETEADYFVETMQNYRESLGELQSLTQEQKEDNQAYVAFKKGEEVPDEYLEKLNSEIKKGNTLTIQQNEIYEANKQRAEDLNVDEAVMPESEPRPTQTQLQKLQQKVRDILNKNLYTLEYTGEDIFETEEPTREELDKFQEYEQRLNGTQADNEVINPENINEYISNLSEDNYLFTHVTTEASAENIIDQGMIVPVGTGVSSTLTLLGNTGVNEQIRRLQNGEVVHRDTTNNSLALISVPKSILDSIQGRDISEKFENWLAENSKLDQNGNYSVPREFNNGYLTRNGFVVNKATSSRGELNQSELSEYQQLSKKLSDWKILDGSIGENNSSITDLLKIIEALKQNVSKIETKIDFTNDDYRLLSNEAEKATSLLEGGSATRVSTPDNVLTFLSEKNGVRKYNFSFISIEKFSSMYPTAQLFIETSKGQELYDPARHKKAAKKEGTSFILREVDEEIKVQVGERARLIVEEQSMKNIPTTMSILNIGVGGQNMVFETLDNGDLVMVEGDFPFSDINGNTLTVGVQAVNSKKKGDVVEFTVDKEDSYNAQLLRDYEKNSEKDPEKALEFLENNLSIYIFGEGSQELLGNLGAISGNEAINNTVERNKEMRKEITQRVLASQDRIVLTGQSAKVNIVLLGSPNIEAQLDEQRNAQPTTVPFTQESVSVVETTGYMKGEESFMSKAVKGVNLTYVKAVAKRNPSLKIPFAVIQYQGKSIAYPIKMNVEQAPRSEELSRIMSSEASPDTKALQVIQLMQETGISPDTYNINFANADWATSEELNLLSDALSENTSFVTADNLADNFDKNRLIDVAQISIDVADSPFRAGKLMIDLNPVNYTRPSSLDIQTNIETSLSDDTVELDRIVRSPEFADISDNDFTDAFDESEVIKSPKNHLEILANLNILKRAFSGKIPASVSKIIGRERINEIKRKIAKQEQQIKITAELKKQADQAKKCN